MIKRTLVTGSTGFIGSHLIHRLISEGWEVHALLRSSSNKEKLLPFVNSIIIHLYGGCISNLNQIFQKIKPDVVFHLASVFLSQHTSMDIDKLIASNVLFPTQLLDAMVSTGCNRIVNTGTSWQHAEQKDHCPVNLYAASKQAFEEILNYYVNAYPLKACSLHLFDTYGPNDPRPKLINLLNRNRLSGEKLAMSPGEQLIDLVYIDDVVEAFLVAENYLEQQAHPHEVYSVSSGALLRLKDLVAAYEKITESQLNIDWGGLPYRPMEVMTPWRSGRKVPGWNPKVNLVEGLGKICQVQS